MSTPNTMWIIASDTEEYGRVYLPCHAGQFRNTVVASVMSKACDEGFRGTIDKRLEQLGWEIVQIKFKEIHGNG